MKTKIPLASAECLFPGGNLTPRKEATVLMILIKKNQTARESVHSVTASNMYNTWHRHLCWKREIVCVWGGGGGVGVGVGVVFVFCLFCFSCINICRDPRKLFEHDVAGAIKCKYIETSMFYRRFLHFFFFFFFFLNHLKYHRKVRHIVKRKEKKKHVQTVNSNRYMFEYLCKTNVYMYIAGDERTTQQTHVVTTWLQGRYNVAATS